MIRRTFVAAVLGAMLAALAAGGAVADGPCGAVPCSSDLSLSAATTLSPVRAGGQTELVFVIADNGPEGAQGVALTHPVPYGLRFVSAEGAPCGLDASGTVTCQVGEMARGQTVEVRVKVEAVQAGAYVTTATVSSTISGDPNHGNDTAQTPLQVEEGPGRRPSAGPPAQGGLVPDSGGETKSRAPASHHPAALAVSAAARQRILETGGLRLRVTPRRSGAIDAKAVVRLPGGRSLVLARVWRGRLRGGRPVRVWLGTTSAMKRTLSNALRRRPRLTATITVRWDGHRVHRTVRRTVTVVA